MGTSSEQTTAATLTVPAGYLDDARRSVVEEIAEDGDRLRVDPELDASARILRRDVELLEQLLGATGDTIVKGERDSISHPVTDMLESMCQLLSRRLETVCGYGPVPMGDVLDIAEQLRWSATEAIRIEPALDCRLEPNDWAEINQTAEAVV